MSRRSSLYDFSIRGDQLEQQRVQLEHNLQHTDLSLHLSSTPDEYSDVECPRHASVPSPPFSAFASFDHRSGDDYDSHEQSRFHQWSYHTDDGVQPYATESLSTAAHHASALTISAGLGGGRTARRDMSFSGAEYDPERPLQGIMAGIAGRFNGFDANSTKSRQITASVVDFDPLIVDDTAELDRVLQSGHAPSGIARSLSSSSSSDITEPISPQPQQESRPRLADALSHLTFSPKRPRSSQSFGSPRFSNITIRSTTPDRSAIARHLPASTPRPQRRGNQSLSYAQNSVSTSRGQAEPAVHITPATPSLRQTRRDHQQQQEKEKDESSKFTAMARGLAREIEEEADAVNKRNSRQTPSAEIPYRATYHHSTVPMRKHQNHRSPLKEMMNEHPDKKSYTGTPFKKSVQLPDVTGLTSAIASPAKVDVEFYGYDPKDTTEAEARLIATLTVVQNKLTHLEAENSVSRRRVRELELELKACKQEVVREQTRIEHERSVMREDEAPGSRKRVQRQRPAQQQQQQKQAGESHVEIEAAEARYRAAVDEKKALEALITTLRTHLTRLTAELSEHKQLLLELRSLRDSDARALAEKSKEVDRLRQEVERLAGEVEVLRGVVEEGLKERRIYREQSVNHDQQPAESTEHSSEEESGTEEPVPESKPQPEQQQLSVQSEDSDDEASEDESISRRSPTPSPRRKQSLGAADQTARTDYATVASSQTHSNQATPKPFLDEEEVSRITQEVEERRSERSIQSRSQENSQSASGSQEGSRNWSRQPNPNQSRRPSRVGSPSMVLESDMSGSTAMRKAVPQLEYSVRFAEEVNQATSSRPTSPYLETTQSHVQSQPQSRPSAPTPATAAARAGSQKRRMHPGSLSDSETPFPQIRGAQLERLFFSAPEHHSETCKVCHRGRRRRPAEVEQAASWLREQQQQHNHSEAGDAEDVRERRGKATRDQVPPQTVLARVLRELEDDFTHYKSIYVELADQYKDMDPVSNVIKRNVLADHLREVIDLLEQKGNQIASLYDLLTFKDKPVSVPVESSTMPGRVPLSRYRNS